MNCVNHPNQDAPYQCYRCRAPICVDCETKIDGHSICPACRAQMQERMAARYEAETRQINYPGGIIAGLVAGVAGAFAWSQFAVWADSRLGIGGALLGGIVGYFVMTGAGGKRGRYLQQIASVLTLLGIIVAYFLILLRTHTPAQLGVTGLGSSGLAAVYALPTYLTSLGLLDWVFLAVGTFWAYWIPHARLLPEQES